MENLLNNLPEEIRKQVESGHIRINTQYDFELPVTRSIPLNSRDKSVLRKFKIWLVDVQDEVFVEDYYFLMDWLPDQPIIKIPKGFVFNGASVPKPLRFILSPKGILYASSIFHDFGYQYNAWLTITNELYLHAHDQSFFDQQFREFNEKVYEMDVIAVSSWVALRAFGRISWSDCRAVNRNIYKAFLQV